MKFVSRYSREARAEVKPYQSISALVAIAVLIILAVVLLTFENIDEPTPLTNLTIGEPESLPHTNPRCDLKMDSGVRVESQLRTSDFKN